MGWGTGISSRAEARAEEAPVAAAAAGAVAGAGAGTKEVKAVGEVEAMGDTAGEVVGAKPKLAASEAVVGARVGAEAEAGTNEVDATTGVVAGAKAEAAAAEAVLNVGAEAEARAGAGWAGAVSAADAGRGAGGVGGTVAEAGVAKTVAAAVGGAKAGDAVGAWRLGFEMNPGEKCWWTVLDNSTMEDVDGPMRLVEALKAFAMSVEVAGLRGDGQLLSELEDVSGGNGQPGG